MPSRRRALHTRQLTFRQLEIFQAVAEAASFTRAGEALSLTQSTVSTQVRKLADVVEAPLFELIGKRVYLTDTGQALLDGSRELFGALDRLEERLAELKGLQRGTLKVAMVTTAKYVAPRLLGPFCARHPGLDVQLKVGNRQQVIDRLAANADDLYVFSHPPQELDIVAVPLVDNPLVVIAPAAHPLAGRRRLRWRQLQAGPWLMREAGSGTRLAIERHMARHGWSLMPRMVIESNEAIKQSVASGLGLSILSRHTLEAAGSTGLAVLDVQGFPIRTRWSLVHLREKRLSVVARAFLDFVNEVGAQVLSPPA